MLHLKEIIQFINDVEEKYISEIMFDSEECLESKKNTWINNLRHKYAFRNNQVSDKHITYISEFLTNLITLKMNEGISVLYRAPGSVGYDGAFLIKNNNHYNLYLSETKSSNLEYDFSQNNYHIQKQNEAFEDLNTKFKNLHSSSASSARMNDNSSIENKVRLVIITREGVESFSDDQKNKLTTQYIDIKRGNKLTHAIGATMSKSENGASPSNINKIFENQLNTILIIESLEDVLKVYNIFMKKMDGLYGK